MKSVHFLALSLLATRWELAAPFSNVSRRLSKVAAHKTVLASSSRDNEMNGQSRRTMFENAAKSLLLGTGIWQSSQSEVGAYYYDEAEERRIRIFERCAPSVVFIDTFTERRDAFSTNVMDVPLGTGSAFVWDMDGHIVTNFHVVRDAKFAQVTFLTKGVGNRQGGGGMNFPRLSPTSRQGALMEADPSTGLFPYTSMRQTSEGMSFMVYRAEVIGVDPSKDIAVLKVNSSAKDILSPIDVGSSTNLRVGQQSLAIGNPFGLDHTLTTGIISGLGREVRSPTGRPISNVIQTDAAINPGNSGGPLLDGEGKLIGINTAIYSPSGANSGIGFAIPVDTVKQIVTTLIRDGMVVRPIMGISYLESRQAQALGILRGVLVLDVPEGSPAYRAGVRGTRRTESGLIEIGDIITKINDVDINTEVDLFRVLEKLKPGDEIVVTVSRLSGTQFDDRMTLREKNFRFQLQSSSDLAQFSWNNSRFHRERQLAS